MNAVARLTELDGGSYLWLLLETMGILALVGGVAYIALRLLGARRLPAKGPIRVLARQPLEPRRTLYLIGVRGRVLLIAASEGGVSTLCELPDEDEMDGVGTGVSEADALNRLAHALEEPRTSDEVDEPMAGSQEEPRTDLVDEGSSSDESSILR